jgi:hypothetical protein
MTSQGGASANGNIFSVGINGTNYQNLVSFTGTSGSANGRAPIYTDLTLSGATLYGMTQQGGVNGDGNVFSVGTDGTNYQNLLSFTGVGGTASGLAPHGSLTLSGTTLYGMTTGNGTTDFGNIFSVGTNGTNYRNLLSFTGTSGAALGNSPYGNVALNGTTLYGMTEGGGTRGLGNVFSVGANGSSYQNLISFTGNPSPANGASPYGRLPFGDLTLSGGTLFGMANWGGSSASPTGYGTIFALTLPTPTPEPGTLALVGCGAAALVSLRWRRRRAKSLACVLALGIALCASRADAQSFKTLLSFTGSGGTAIGENPFGSLIISGTTLYGVTSGLAEKDFPHGFDGNVFSVGVDGTNYQNLLTFTGTGGAASGWLPQGNLAISGTTLYGTTQLGGSNTISGSRFAYGNVFSVGLNGTSYRNLLSFTGAGGAANGDGPLGSLVLSGTTLYGTTNTGGFNFGNLFSVGTGGGNYQNLVMFSSTNGDYPAGTLTISGTTRYGMALAGGGSSDGGVFSVGTNGANFENLLSFTGTGGAAPGANAQGGLTLSGTTLYGMTQFGGADRDGNVFCVGPNGTSYRNLLSFTGSGSGAANGSYPVGDLTISGTTLFGMTSEGGVNGYGNIFSVGIDGSGYEDLYDFTGGADGGYPHGYLTLSSGTLFGMTTDVRSTGSTTVIGNGTLFALTLPAPTPEPGTLALVGCGVLALVASRCRRMRSKTRG